MGLKGPTVCASRGRDSLFSAELEGLLLILQREAESPDKGTQDDASILTLRLEGRDASFSIPSSAQ